MRENGRKDSQGNEGGCEREEPAINKKNIIARQKRRNSKNYRIKDNAVQTMKSRESRIKKK